MIIFAEPLPLSIKPMMSTSNGSITPELSTTVYALPLIPLSILSSGMISGIAFVLVGNSIVTVIAIDKVSFLSKPRKMLHSISGNKRLIPAVLFNQKIFAVSINF